MDSFRPLAIAGAVVALLLGVGVLTGMRYVLTADPAAHPTPVQLTPAATSPPPQQPPPAAVSEPRQHPDPVPAEPTDKPAEQVPAASSRTPAEGTAADGTAADKAGPGGSAAGFAPSPQSGEEHHRPRSDRPDRHDDQVDRPAEQRMRQEMADSICDRYHMPRENCEHPAIPGW